MKKFSKILSIILSILMIVSIIPITVNAATYSGKCGAYVTWSYNTSTYTLTISGTGAMYDYDDYYRSPWECYKDNIETVIINNGVTTIGDMSFRFYDNLICVIIPNSIKEIGYGAFAWCKNLKNVSIPNSVTVIDYYAFGPCAGLENITVDVNNQYYSSDEHGVLFNKNKTILIQYPAGNSRSSYVVPNSVTTIYENAFNLCASLESLTIGNKVTTIGCWAFYSCYNLSNVYYLGTKEQWKRINIEVDNEELTNAVIHYNCFGYKGVITPPTCTTQGCTVYTCDCGYSYKSDYTNETGHTYISEITTPATHLITGVETFTCHCGDSYTKTIAKTTEHTYESVITQPTCTTQGYTTYTCACGNSYVADYVSVAPHKLEWVTLSVASCTTNGVMHGYCEDCTYYEVQTTPMTDHADNDDDGKCDTCPEILDPTLNCDCNCHKSGISKFFFNLILFFQKLFGSNQICNCGIAHY